MVYGRQMLKKRHSLRVALSAVFLALVMLMTAQVVSSPVTNASSGSVTANAAKASTSTSSPIAQRPVSLSRTERRQARRSRRIARRAFFRSCRHRTSRKFNERQARFSRRVRVGARCVVKRVPGIKVIGTRPGHHPSASRALDIMVNTRGSCREGRRAGNRVARYFMNNKRRHGVYYVIWRNGYWNARDSKMPISQFRKMGRGGCTQGHYDHVHVAFK